MTTLAISTPALRPFPLPWGTVAGASDDAELIAQKTQDFFRGLARTAFGSERLEQPFQEVDELFQRCRFANWDRDGAMPITRDAVAEAKTILLSLPPMFPLPEISAEATGAIVLEWYREPGRRYAATVSGNRTIEFAALLGPGNDIWGELRLMGGLPKQMRAQLHDLYFG